MAISTHFVTAPYAVAGIPSAMLLFYSGLALMLFKNCKKKEGSYINM